MQTNYVRDLMRADVASLVDTSFDDVMDVFAACAARRATSSASRRCSVACICTTSRTSSTTRA